MSKEKKDALQDEQKIRGGVIEKAVEDARPALVETLNGTLTPEQRIEVAKKLEKLINYYLLNRAKIPESSFEIDVLMQFIDEYCFSRQFIDKLDQLEQARIEMTLIRLLGDLEKCSDVEYSKRRGELLRALEKAKKAQIDISTYERVVRKLEEDRYISLVDHLQRGKKLEEEEKITSLRYPDEIRQLLLWGAKKRGIKSV